MRTTTNKKDDTERGGRIMSPHKLIKKEGLGRLRGHWPAALGALLIPAAVGTLLAMAAGAAAFVAVARLTGQSDDP